MYDIYFTICIKMYYMYVLPGIELKFLFFAICIEMYCIYNMFCIKI